MLLLFFFKQKTAYDLRISDWSSDVCSSDLPHAAIDSMTLNLLGRRYTIATMKHLPVAARFVAMMPQWDLLDFIAAQGRRYPRSEGRRVGKEWVSTWWYRWSPEH